MALPLWYETGRDFAADVLDGHDGRAGVFEPASAFEIWFDFHYGCGPNPFHPGDWDDEWTDTAWNLLRYVVNSDRKARSEFARGYCDAMRETRLSRRIAAHRAA